METRSMKLALALWCVCAALTVGCARSSSERTEESSSSEVSAAERSQYEGTAEQRLAQLGARIDSLKAEADAAGDRTESALRQEIEQLENKRQEAGQKLRDLRTAQAERWDDVKRQMGDMLDDLDRRFDQARAKLRENRG